MCSGLNAAAATGRRSCTHISRALLGEAPAQAHQVAEGLRTFDNAFALIELSGERFFEVELHRLRGDLLLQLAEPDHIAAEDSFRRALEVAHAQGAKSLELRAAIGAARLLAAQQRAAEGHRLLSEVYGSFTEGFDTHDLLDARIVLKQLEA